MKPIIARKWYDALVSGKYTQCSGTLRRTKAVQNTKVPNVKARYNRPGYCCLGVLSEVVCRMKAVKAVAQYDMHDGAWRVKKYSKISANIPRQVCEVIGLDGEVTDKLIDMNDFQGKTFPEIAEVIRRKYLVGTKYDPKPGKQENAA